MTSSAAASALGKIANEAALEALQKAFAAGKTQQSMVDGLLACANQLLANGKGAQAGAAFKQVADLKTAKDHVRTAAAQGQMRSAGNNALGLVLNGIAGDDAPVQLAALQLARDLKDPTATEALANLVGKVKPAVQFALVQVLVQRGDPAGAPALIALAKGDDVTLRYADAFDACGALLPAAEIRVALREATRSTDAQVKTAGIRALCGSRDSELLPDILELANKSQETSVRSQAIRGYVRLVTEEEAKLSPGEKAALLKPILNVAQRQEEKWAVLAGLATIPNTEALDLVMPMVEQAGLQAEAGQAAIQIAGALRGSHPTVARAALKKIVAATPDANRRKTAETLLAQMDAMADFITAWQMAGPYEESGKGHDMLFNTAFAPEKPGSNVSWRLMATGTSAQMPFLMDILKAMGGEQKVAYVRTRIFSPAAQAARMELGTDDGVKAWLNGKLVHSHNIARPIVVGADKVNVELKEGWNDLMMKITQNSMGWEFCARMVNTDGSRIEGIRFGVPE